MLATSGQLAYEWGHLIAKLRVRDPAWLENFIALTQPRPHPLFQIAPGPVADWEVTRRTPSIHRTPRDKAAQRR